MANVIDDAQRSNEVYREAALQAHFAHTVPITSLISKQAKRNCEDCGKAIPQGRLKANPAAKKCIGCQTKYERKG